MNQNARWNSEINQNHVVTLSSITFKGGFYFLYLPISLCVFALFTLLLPSSLFPSPVRCFVIACLPSLWIPWYDGMSRIMRENRTPWLSVPSSLTFRGPCVVVYSYNRSQRDALFLNFILVMNSTCFGQTYCPSSGVLILYSQQMVFVILVMLTVC